MNETTTLGLEPEDQRHLAGALYNRVWDLLDLGAARTDEQTHEMIEAAYASRLSWRELGTSEQWIIGEWQISRAWAAAGNGELAVTHGQIAHELLRDADELPDWLEASVLEGLARAHLASDDAAQAAVFVGLALDAAESIADADDRSLIVNQIEELQP